MSDFAFAEYRRGTFRLIPSRYPPVQILDRAASPEDLAAGLELEGWTSDRLNLQRLERLPRDQWVFGFPNSSIVMAAFIHCAPKGSRFNSGDLGAWYASATIKTGIAEVAHHARREVRASGISARLFQYRCYHAYLRGRQYVDLRDQRAVHPELYEANSYAQSMTFGESVRAAGFDGIVYESLRHKTGTNLAAYKPRQITDPVSAEHFEIDIPSTGRIVARKLP